MRKAAINALNAAMLNAGETMTTRERVEQHMQTYYRKSLDDLEITDTPGYWRDKKLCGGREKCHAPIHQFIHCEGGIQHTYYFAEYGRDKKGRFLRPFRAWEELKKEQEAVRA